MTAATPPTWPTPKTLANAEWPPDYVAVFGWRQQQLAKLRRDQRLLTAARAYYADRYAEFINHWMFTYDPRLASKDTPAKLPFILFQRQEEMVQFLDAMIAGEENGLIEKARDMGATWICAAYSVCLFLFMPGASVGWGSRKEQLVDKIGDPDSIFEKIRFLLRTLPPEFLPRGFDVDGHTPYMKLVNPENGATITGEAGDNIGRGGRKLIYFKDESAHYERPEKIEAALGDNTRVQIDISSVNGTANVFYRKREAGEVWHGGPAIEGVTNVLVLDWRDHPEKTQAWYDKRKKQAEEQGLQHLFAQEVDRNYAAAVVGVIIPPHYVQAAIDSHIKLKWPEPTGPNIGGLDVADDSENGDKNAYAERKGYLLKTLEQWGGVDTTVTTNRAVMAATQGAEIEYDCIGVGAGVKGESNRLEASGQLPRGTKFYPWNASASPTGKGRHILELSPGVEDKQSPTAGDYYQNLSAQAAWELRLRFERTWLAVTEGREYDHDTMVSIPSSLPNFHELVKQLSQPTITRSQATGKMMVNKKPDGARSPNLFDAVKAAFWPSEKHKPSDFEWSFNGETHVA